MNETNREALTLKTAARIVVDLAAENQISMADARDNGMPEEHSRQGDAILMVAEAIEELVGGSLEGDPEPRGSEASTRHTPTPWTCHSGMIWKLEKGVFPDGFDNGIPIARMDREPGNGTTPTERDANAKRIVECVNAMPELLAALEASLQYCWVRPEDMPDWDGADLPDLEPAIPDQDAAQATLNRLKQIDR